MKKFFIVAVCLLSAFAIKAQPIVEDFEANSLEWSEFTFSSGFYAQIKKGKMSIFSQPIRYSSPSETGTFALLMDMMDPDPIPTHWNRMAHTHCLAPIDVQKDFTIRTNLVPTMSSTNSCVGILFNYRDEGNYYCIAYNSTNGVRFSRLENGRLVGWEEIPMVPKNNKQQMEWELVKDGDVLIFRINQTEFLKIRYAPMTFRGFGFFAYGGSSMNVDDVTFVQ